MHNALNIHLIDSGIYLYGNVTDHSYDNHLSQNVIFQGIFNCRDDEKVRLWISRCYVEECLLLQNVVLLRYSSIVHVSRSVFSKFLVLTDHQYNICNVTVFYLLLLCDIYFKISLSPYMVSKLNASVYCAGKFEQC